MKWYSYSSVWNRLSHWCIFPRTVIYSSAKERWTILPIPWYSKKDSKYCAASEFFTMLDISSRVLYWPYEGLPGDETVSTNASSSIIFRCFMTKVTSWSESDNARLPFLNFIFVLTEVSIWMCDKEVVCSCRICKSGIPVMDINYTVTNMGNRTKHASFLPDVAEQFDSNRLWKEINKTTHMKMCINCWWFFISSSQIYNTIVV